jgi:BirA family biotin operon repressor/biotin-[acetyl-CoA-carboxylase] ligase
VLKWRSTPPADTPTARTIRTGLRTRTIARNVISLRRATSTSAVAMALAADGCPDGTVVTADEQTRGRGRLGRSWHSPAGAGLWFSVVLRPDLPLSRAQVLTFLGAVAVARALRDLHGIPARLKWPNDVVAGGRKLAGVLTEVAGEQGLVRHVVVGVGINVLIPAALMPGALREEAGSVADFAGGAASGVARVPILRRVLEEMDSRYRACGRDGGAALVREWRSLTHMNGTIVRLRHMARTWEGTVVGVDPDGSLLLRMASGVTHHFVAGDVTVLREDL